MSLFRTVSLAVIAAFALSSAMAADIKLPDYQTVTLDNAQPWRGLLQIASSENCDLICMASHGRGGLSALLLGSETQKVLTHSHLPVMVVR